MKLQITPEAHNDLREIQTHINHFVYIIRILHSRRDFMSVLFDVKRP